MKKKHGVQGLVILAFVAFISLGLPDGLLGVAWPSIRSEFALPLDALGLLLAAATIGYMVSSFLSGALVRKLGVGRLLALSCAATGIALIGYTVMPSWYLISAMGVLAGLGAGAIDAGLNNYVAENHGEGLMQWLHASFGIGITLGPIIMTAGLNIFSAWRVGYYVVGSAQILLGLAFFLTANMWVAGAASKSSQLNNRETSIDSADEQLLNQATLFETMGHGKTWISIAMFFIYTGVELSLGHWAYTLLTESRGFLPEVAGAWVGGYWGSFTLGRILAGLYAGRVGANRLVTASIILAAAGAFLIWLNLTPWISLGGILLTGFAIAPIFPGMVSATKGRVGARHTANTIGMQIGAAGLGGAVLPTISGSLARVFGLEVITLFLLSMVGLLFLLFTLPMVSLRKKA